MPLLTSAQGYVVTNEGDTIRCAISLFRSHNTVTRVDWKAKGQAEQTARPMSIKGGGDVSGDYLSAIVTTDQSPTLIQLRTDTVFLEYLSIGKMSLLTFTDKFLKKHFIVLTEDKQLRELILHEEIITKDNRTFRSSTLSYRTALKELFPDCKSLHGEVDRTAYDEVQIKAVFKKLYACKYDAEAKDRNIIKSNHYVGLVAGANFVQLSYPKYFHTFPYSFSPTFGITYESRTNLPGFHLSLRNELQVRMIDSFSDSAVQRSTFPRLVSKAHVQMTHIRYNLLLRHYFSTGKVRGFASVGVGYGFLVSMTNSSAATIYGLTTTTQTTNDYLGGYNKSEYSVIVGTGIDAERFGAEVRFEYGTGIQPAVSSTGSPVQSLGVFLYYRFLAL